MIISVQELTDKCKNADRISIDFFTQKYRNGIVFNKMKEIVNDYLELWYR